MHPSNKALIGVVSAGLIASAAFWEGTRYYAYKDIAGIPTVCEGYTGSGIIFGKKYSREECNHYTHTELAAHGKGVLECIKAPLEEHQYNAFTLMAYNVGVNGFCGSQTVKLFNAGNVDAACRRMAYTPKGEPNWSFVDGKYVKGLHNRRIYEMKMCLGEQE
jgi:lysozyme